MMTFWRRDTIGRLLCVTALLAAPAAAEDAASDDKLEKKANPAESQARQLSERILQNTTGVRDKLSGKDLGSATQRQQQEVVDDLQALVDLLKKSPPPPPQQNPSDSNSNSNSDSSSDSQDQQQQNSSKSSQSKPSRGSKSPSQGTGAEQNRSQAEDSSEERRGESRESKQRADRKLRLENDIWGHLPPALREELLNTYGERMLPQYEDFVRKFYEALSEPNRTKKR